MIRVLFAPVGIWGCIVPGFIFRQYINHLLAYLTFLLTFCFNIYFLAYLIRQDIGQFCFQAGWHKTRLNLAFVFVSFCVGVYFIWMLVSFLFCFDLKNVSEMIYFVSGGT